MQKIRKGDEVMVLRGKDRGRRGKVLKVLPREGLAVVEGVNEVTKHQRAGLRSRKAGINKISAPLPLCALALVSKKDGKPVRVRIETREKGGRIRKVRVATRTGEIFE